MSKKTIKGFLKSNHFHERQNERKVSDAAIRKAITHGHLKKHESGTYFIDGHLKVTVDFENSTLITVHPGDPSKNTKKVLTKEEAKELEAIIKADSIVEKDEFQQYVDDFKVKKLK